MGRVAQNKAREISLSDIDHDTKVTLRALIAKGQPAEQIAEQTGAPIDIVKAIQSTIGS